MVDRRPKRRAVVGKRVRRGERWLASECEEESGAGAMMYVFMNLFICVFIYLFIRLSKIGLKEIK